VRTSKGKSRNRGKTAEQGSLVLGTVSGTEDSFLHREKIVAGLLGGEEMRRRLEIGRSQKVEK